MENKLSDNELLAISKDEWESSDCERELAADLLSTRAQLAACQKNLSDLCPIADMPVIESLKAEKLAMMEELAALQYKVRWRKVEDGLPESEKSYLVLVDGEAHEDYLQDGRWFSGNEVTHWMPLPVQPEEG